MYIYCMYVNSLTPPPPSSLLSSPIPVYTSCKVFWCRNLVVSTGATQSAALFLPWIYWLFFFFSLFFYSHFFIFSNMKEPASIFNELFHHLAFHKFCRKLFEPHDFQHLFGKKIILHVLDHFFSFFYFFFYSIIIAFEALYCAEIMLWL